MDIHLYHHFPPSGEIDSRLDRILAEVRALRGIIMGLADDINAKLDAAQQSLNGISGDVTELKNELAAALAGGTGISQTDGEAILARVSALSDAMNALDLQTPPATPPAPAPGV